jgi:hypothetical protein
LKFNRARNVLRRPDNQRLLFLSPYALELNPGSFFWDELPEKNFHNRVLDSPAAVGAISPAACMISNPTSSVSTASPLGRGLLMPVLPELERVELGLGEAALGT